MQTSAASHALVFGAAHLLLHRAQQRLMVAGDLVKLVCRGEAEHITWVLTPEAYAFQGSNPELQQALLRGWSLVG